MKKSRSMSRLVGSLSLSCLLAGGFNAAADAAAKDKKHVDQNACDLRAEGGKIKHVIYLQFDNTHFLRDNPHVPSDLEQMPNLLNFIKKNGTLLTNDHTILISHTGGGILSALTGVYPDRHGQAVSNSYRYFRADGSTASSSSFKYWTDLVDDTSATPTDPLPNMVNDDSGTPKNAPAPWVPYTRAGCDFGTVANANIVLENIGTGPNGDMTKVFGLNSPEWLEADASNKAPFGSALRNLAQTNYVGIAIHCGKGGGICDTSAHARPDLLPDEPGGYNNYKALFGAKYVNPAITGGAAVVKDLNGNPIQDQFGQPGFPGFDGVFPAVTLAYIATMQEKGIPITFGYLSDAHDSHGVAGEVHIARGPGQKEYVDQLKAYDDAFGKFFKRLEAAGITKENTLFVFTVEEGDHFVGAQPTPANCDGVNTPCNYSLLGEINANLAGLLSNQQSITTPFTVHSDMAPTIYITGNPSRTDTTTRNFGRALSKLTAVSPYTGLTDQISVALADPVGMDMLHMITADPQRTPTLTLFANPNYFLFAASTCTPNPPECVSVPTTTPTSTFAWNHGSIDPEIAQIWLGIVGPGVRQKGKDDKTWLDHTDVRPTMLRLLGLKDSYVHDGRVVTEVLERPIGTFGGKAQQEALLDLGTVYKQLNAPFGQLSQDSLKISTAAVSSNTAGDATYTKLSNKLIDWTKRRDAIALEIIQIIHGANFEGEPVFPFIADYWFNQAELLLNEVRACANDTASCAK